MLQSDRCWANARYVIAAIGEDPIPQYVIWFSIAWLKNIFATLSWRDSQILTKKLRCFVMLQAAVVSPNTYGPLISCSPARRAWMREFKSPNIGFGPLTEMLEWKWVNWKRNVSDFGQRGRHVEHMHKWKQYGRTFTSVWLLQYDLKTKTKPMRLALMQRAVMKPTHGASDSSPDKNTIRPLSQTYSWHYWTCASVMRRIWMLRFIMKLQIEWSLSSVNPSTFHAGVHK